MIIDNLNAVPDRIAGFEYKWRTPHVRPPQSFLETYPEATFTVITPENFLVHVGVRKQTGE